MHMGAECRISVAIQLKLDGGAAADQLYRHVYTFGIV